MVAERRQNLPTRPKTKSSEEEEERRTDTCRCGRLMIKIETGAMNGRTDAIEVGRTVHRAVVVIEAVVNLNHAKKNEVESAARGVKLLPGGIGAQMMKPMKMAYQTNLQRAVDATIDRIGQGVTGTHQKAAAARSQSREMRLTNCTRKRSARSTKRQRKLQLPSYRASM